MTWAVASDILSYSSVKNCGIGGV